MKTFSLFRSVPLLIALPVAAWGIEAQPPVKSGPNLVTVQPSNLAPTKVTNTLVTDVKKMVEAGAEPEVVKAFIQNWNSWYSLTADDILRLHGEGVTSDVLTTLIRHSSELQARVSAPQNPGPMMGGATNPPAMLYPYPGDEQVPGMTYPNPSPTYDDSSYSYPYSYPYTYSYPYYAYPYYTYPYSAFYWSFPLFYSWPYYRYHYPGYGHYYAHGGYRGYYPGRSFVGNHGGNWNHAVGWSRPANGFGGAWSRPGVAVGRPGGWAAGGGGVARGGWSGGGGMARGGGWSGGGGAHGGGMGHGGGHR